MRNKLVIYLYEKGVEKYLQNKKKEAWTLLSKDLHTYPPYSLGQTLKRFLELHQFDLMPRGENHDVMHVLTGHRPGVLDELLLQFYLLGNGKRSKLVVVSCLFALLLYPDHWIPFIKRIFQGYQAEAFHHINFEKRLHENLFTIRNQYNIHYL